MPNPFPGMNPYFENPSDWREIHAALIYCLRAAIAEVILPPFQARMEERVYIQDVDKEYIADALVVERLRPDTAPIADTTLPGFEPKVFDPPHRIQFNSIPEKESFIEIRSRKDSQVVIAVIEILSPKNKTSGRGRSEYLRKQQDLLASNAHFLEIDLLRAGQYSLAPPENELRERLGKFDYLISLHHAQNGTEFDLWPVLLRDRLPRLYLPLAEDKSVIIDLQAVVERAYNDGHYDDIIDYTVPPVPPLSPGDAEWANKRIAARNAANGTMNETEMKDL